MMNRIGILGGMFDPVHKGHLQVAMAALQTLKLDQLRMIPCHRPNHRAKALCPEPFRLAMLGLATRHIGQIVVDERELRRPGTSYTVDTLASLREEYRNDSLVLILGMDAFALLSSWHNWQKLAELCHFLVVSRPGYKLEATSEEGKFLAARRKANAEDLFSEPCGGVLVLEDLAIDVSSSQVRGKILAKEPLDELVPADVERYLYNNNLYQSLH
jgi:nicotinate-nucleotide adenylyltransferase